MANLIANRIDTVFIHVSDLNRSIAWYGKLLGINVEKKDYPGPIYTFDMGAGRPGLTLDNHCFDDDYRLIPSNQPLFNLSTTDIDAAYQFVVQELGAAIVTEIQAYPDLADFSFEDPDGNIIMICTRFT